MTLSQICKNTKNLESDNRPMWFTVGSCCNQQASHSDKVGKNGSVSTTSLCIPHETHASKASPIRMTQAKVPPNICCNSSSARLSLSLSLTRLLFVSCFSSSPATAASSTLTLFSRVFMEDSLAGTLPQFVLLNSSMDSLTALWITYLSQCSMTYCSLVILTYKGMTFLPVFF